MFPVYQCVEWQCRYVAEDKRCCVLPLNHEGEHQLACCHDEAQAVNQGQARTTGANLKAHER